MRKILLVSTAALIACTLDAADAGPKEAVLAAAKKLGEQSSYSWKVTVAIPEGSDTRFRPGPTEGKIEKGGLTYVTQSRGDNTTQIVLKGEQAAITDSEGAWRSLAELENAEGRDRFLAFAAQGILTPAEDVTETVALVKDLKKDGEVYSGDLTEEGAKRLIGFRRRGGATGGSTITNAKGSAKFWIKDGNLSKYEYKVSGTMEFNGNSFDRDRTTTVEIKDVGTTKVNAPEAAKKKLS